MFLLRLDVCRSRTTIIRSFQTTVKKHPAHSVYAMQYSGVIFFHKLRDFCVAHVKLNTQAVEHLKPRLQHMPFAGQPRDFRRIHIVMLRDSMQNTHPTNRADFIQYKSGQWRQARRARHLMRDLDCLRMIAANPLWIGLTQGFSYQPCVRALWHQTSPW